MTVLLLDNHDSYTYNLAELIARVAGADPVVVTNDAMSVDEVLALPVDAIVVSPGPGTPEHGRDVGIGPELLRRARVPVLGVCLGHQLIAHGLGARVVPADPPAHGIASTVLLGDDPLFAGMPRRIEVIRYHSLCVATPLPAALEPIAVAADGTLMALRVRGAPRWGVQFHPEAACTEHGDRLLANFLRHARLLPGRPGPPPRRTVPHGSRRLVLTTRTVHPAPDPLRVFRDRYAHRPPSFWLDTNDPRESPAWSFMGAPDAARDHVLTAAGRRVTVDGGHGRTVDSVWEHCARMLGRYTVAPAAEPPFQGGYVGYLGYGLATSTIAAARPATAEPDLALMFVSRFLAFDHTTDRLLVCALHDEDDRAEAMAWLDRTAADLAAPGPPGAPTATVPPVDVRGALAASALTGPERYRAAVRRCIEEIRLGESYEVCLTTGFTGPPLDNPFEVYRTLRRINPAPYAAYLDLGTTQLLSSSPERFLRILPDGSVETKPIKGTSPRARTAERDAERARALAADPKMRAENMMIVDLLRNDLNRVCDVGTVRVASLMHVETYATVHQLVSTITGRLAGGVGRFRAVEACFPGGSMTGAPKLRTMEIITGLEPHARGVYSGAAGLFSVNGYVDLSIVIRSIVNGPAGWFVGAGGAVLVGSDPQEEYEEMLQKAAPAVHAILASGTVLPDS